MEVWITIEDLRSAVIEAYDAARAKGHSHDAAVAGAAAFLAVHRDQIAHPKVSMGLVDLLLSDTRSKG